jgi:2-iminobutanoate/2-iminopropanoate deaminase
MCRHVINQVLPICLLGLSLAGCAAMEHEAGIHSVAVADAPKAVGPYVQGVVAGGFLYTAGQIPREPTTGNLVAGDIVVQTNRVLDNLEAVLKGAGCTLHDVVKVTVYMTDLGDFTKMNEAYAARFGENRPARTTIQVAKLPTGATLEMDMVARIPR